MNLTNGPFARLQISIRKSGDVTMVDLRGKFTANGGESELLRSRLEKLVGNGVRKLLLNLTDLTQIDSSGVSILAKTYISLKQQGGHLRLLGPRGQVLQVLGVLRLRDIVESFEDEAQALTSFQPLGHFARP